MTKKYEPFNLERALAGEPVVLKDGKKAYVRYCEGDIQTLHPLLGYVEWKGYNIPLTWSKCGKQDVDYHGESDIVGMFPQNILIQGVEVPTFRNWIPDIGEMVYVVRLDLSVPLEVKEWRGTPRDMCALERGLVYPHTMRGLKAARLLAKTLVAAIQEG